MKLCVFDFDSTLMDGETIDILARAAGKEAEVSAITEAAMAGDLDFFESLTKRVGYLKGLSYPKTLDICTNLPLMLGAKESIAAIKSRGYQVAIFSGGFREATRHYATVLGADAEFANFLHHKDQHLTGLVGGEMMTNEAKGSLLERLQTLLKVKKEDTVAVGDGANDASMFARAATRIAFCAKPTLKEKANYTVEEKDLRTILKYIPA